MVQLKISALVGCLRRADDYIRALAYTVCARRCAAKFAKILTAVAFAMQNNALKFRLDHGCNSADNFFCFSPF